MSNVANLSDVAANAEASALAALLNNGIIAIYAGVQPVTCNTPLSGNTLLAELLFGTPAFQAPVGGVLTANPITSVLAVASGTATFARLYESDGLTAVMDVQVGASGAGISLANTAVVVSTVQSISQFIYSVVET
jgi:hypothetical protein